MKSIFLPLLLLATCALPLNAADRPNILWITSEDNAWNWLGCYGNKEAQTPRMDALAKQGIRFMHAYSNAPVCAVARSTILNGAYAVTQGTQHMRSRHPIPDSFKSYVSYLRDQGYYCSNNSKTDYNFKGNDAAIWDDCSNSAHYKNRPKDKPFFAIFNLTISHESSLFPQNISANRKRGTIPKTPRLDPAKVTVPPYLPDLPEIRNDIAVYHDNLTALDTQIGQLLDELENAGLADDTIVFYYSDHGGITPRGKRYLEDTGTHVPMIISVPEKWRAMSTFKPGAQVDELVSFVDLAPTVLSLAGIGKPPQMQGRAFLGPMRSEPPGDALVFLYADRFDEIYGMRRAITDGRWKYIRRFTPHLPAAPYSFYQFGQQGWTAWRKAWQDGTLPERFNQIWQSPQPVEELFDTLNDPWEIHNLAGNSEHSAKLESMRGRLRQKMIDTTDTGIIPEPMFAGLASGQPVATYLANRKSDLPQLVDLVFAATSRDESKLPLLIKNLSSGDPLARYWAAQGCLILGKPAATASTQLTQLLHDTESSVRVAAAHALVACGHEELGKPALLAELEKSTGEYEHLNAINTIFHLQLTAEIPATWKADKAGKGNGGNYLSRFLDKTSVKRPQPANPNR